MNSNPCGVECYHGYSQTCPYQVPFTYHFDGHRPGSYLVQLSDGSIVLVTAVVTARTYRDQQTVSTRFRKNKKKRGYLNACQGRIRKHGKHHYDKGNTDKMHHIGMLFDEYLPSYFRKVAMRYSYKRSNLCGTSSFQKDVEVKDEDEEEEEKSNEHQVLDESLHRDATKILSQLPLVDQGYLLLSESEKSASKEIYNEPSRNEEITLFATPAEIEVTNIVPLRALKLGFGCREFVLNSEEFVEDSLSSGCTKYGEDWFANRLFEDISSRNMVPEIVVICYSTWKGEIEKGLQLPMFVLVPYGSNFKLSGCLNMNISLDSSRFVESSLMSWYFKSGMFEDAIKFRNPNLRELYKQPRNPSRKNGVSGVKRLGSYFGIWFNTEQLCYYMFFLEYPDTFDTFVMVFDQLSRSTRLQRIQCSLAGKNPYIRFSGGTRNAVGMNLVSKEAPNSSEFLQMEVGVISSIFYLEKNDAAVNWIQGSGKSVVREVVISLEVVKEVLKTSISALIEFNMIKNLTGSNMAGPLSGCNAQATNSITRTVENYHNVTFMAFIDGKDLHVSVTTPFNEEGVLASVKRFNAFENMELMIGISFEIVDRKFKMHEFEDMDMAEIFYMMHYSGYMNHWIEFEMSRCNSYGPTYVKFDHLYVHSLKLRILVFEPGGSTFSICDNNDIILEVSPYGAAHKNGNLRSLTERVIHQNGGRVVTVSDKTEVVKTPNTYVNIVEMGTAIVIKNVNPDCSGARLNSKGANQLTKLLKYCSSQVVQIIVKLVDTWRKMMLPLPLLNSSFIMPLLKWKYGSATQVYLLGNETAGSKLCKIGSCHYYKSTAMEHFEVLKKQGSVALSRKLLLASFMMFWIYGSNLHLRIGSLLKGAYPHGGDLIKVIFVFEKLIVEGQSPNGSVNPTLKSFWIGSTREEVLGVYNGQHAKSRKFCKVEYKPQFGTVLELQLHSKSAPTNTASFVTCSVLKFLNCSCNFGHQLCTSAD
ncbi:3-hydroxy-3-methylglutaryl-coenzyme a reductase 1 [Nicotiana attenuata]|uniref:3-hydroxy-3-methylglutaryl-coenzyme a reductase 1 n=1 Tax=Nicotiana attenuata TaxID=49451 RepID=A0A1J6JEL8_NICAT|nr:3-hydroxy-3-methylglutaryl-coenzyme a reductase 1 [Nicotiana attenuata]